MLNKLNYFVLLLCSFISLQASGQMLYIESFEGMPVPNPSLSLPYGWTQAATGTDPDNYFNRISAGQTPLAAPHSGNALLRYNSFLTNSGLSCIIASRPLDMTGIFSPAAINFWFYRDANSYQSKTDRIEVYYNSSPSLSGAQLLTETVTAASTLHRSCALSPLPVTNNGWNQYFYAIPSTFNTQLTYFIIKAISDNGFDMYVDDVSINTYPGTQVFVPNASAVNQNTTYTYPGLLNQHIITGKINVTGMVNPLVIDSVIFNTNGSTSPPTDIVNAKLWFSGGTNSFDENFATLIGTYSQPWGSSFMMLTANIGNYTGMSTFTGLHNGENYFWLTYDISQGAIICDVVDAEIVSFTSGNTTYNFIPHTITGNRPIGNCTGIEGGAIDNLQNFFVYTEADMLHVSFTNTESGNYKLHLTDQLGRILFTDNIFSNSGENTFSLKEKLSSGIYQVTLSNSSSSITRKFVVVE
jgi:hypothetical protein